MRILYLNPGAQMGGAEASLLELLAGIRDSEPEWHLSLLLGADGPFTAKATSLGVSVHVLPMPAAFARAGDSRTRNPVGLLLALVAAISYGRRLAHVIRDLSPDLIHATGFKMHVLSPWVRPPGIPLIWHIHDYVQSRPFSSRLLRWHSRGCSRAIVNSRSVAADLRSATRQKAEIVYNAVDLQRFSPHGPALNLDALSGLAPADGILRVGLVATFAHWKGHHTFLKALSLLPPDAPVRGYIIGGPIYQTAGS